MKRGLFTLLFLCTAGFIWAQNARLTGTISHATSQEPLSGAQIMLKGTTMGTFAEDDGSFTLNEIPAGTYEVVVSYIGFEGIAEDITFAANATVERNFSLKESAFIGDEVVISASRRPEKVTQAPATISIINAEDYEEHAGFNTGELLARQKGVDFIRTGVLGTGINVRGFNSAFNPKNLQMNDGRLSSLIATGLPFGSFSPTIKEDIERVEVILGPSAALYGPNAHNGLVNTISKDPRDSEGTTIALGGGNQSVLTGRVRNATVINDKLAFKINAEYTQGEDFEYMDTVYIGDFAFDELDLDRTFNTVKGEASLYYTPKKNNDIILTYGASNNNNLAATNAGRNQIKDWRVAYFHAQYKSPRLFAQLYHTWSGTDSTYAINQRTQNYTSYIANGFSEDYARQMSYTNQYFPLSDTTGIDLARGAIFKDKSRRINGEIQYNNEVAGFQYIVGTQVQRDIANSLGTYLLDDPDNPIVLDQIGVYAQVERLFGEHIKFVGAMRADYHELYGFNLIPKAALLGITDHGVFRLTYGKGIAAPTILNLSGDLFGGLVLGNGEGFTLSDGTVIDPLQVEKINTIEIGYKGDIQKKLFIDANAYFNMSKDFLSPLTNIATNGRTVTMRGETPMSEVIPGTPEAGSGFLLTYLNFGQVNTYGFDLGLNYYFNDQFKANLNYSYFGYDLDETDMANDGNGDGVVLPTDLPINTPAHKLSVGLTYSHQKFFANTLVRWVDGYDFFSGINVAAAANEDLGIVENARYGRTWNYGQLGGFVNVDVAAGYRINDMFTVSAQVTNLFDADVREFVASPFIGRLISAELKVNLPNPGN
ncbi:TonB-dependent receptor [Pontibacter sp. G13]|uniref:TonB-dependent receptor n=1 Tax=Pontibacter sp. G13 TaxID=3074898 RepID=UPI0028899814|nr:TonB-dependent receptor [Pontibacter sp. G13]WNJ20471.1 TonB-dependent receptor [Pontibacter sp. G13]